VLLHANETALRFSKRSSNLQSGGDCGQHSGSDVRNLGPESQIVSDKTAAAHPHETMSAGLIFPSTCRQVTSIMLKLWVHLSCDECKLIQSNTICESVQKKVELVKFVNLCLIMCHTLHNKRAPHSSNLGSESALVGATFDFENINRDMNLPLIRVLR